LLLVYLVSHGRPGNVNTQLLHKARLSRLVDERVGLEHPELLHQRPRAHDDGTLVAHPDLDDVRRDLLAPFREDGGVVLLEAATKGLEMADEGKRVSDFWDPVNLLKVGAVCLLLCFFS